MSLESSALLLAWAVIVLLTFGMAGLLRQMRFLTQALRDRGETSVQAIGAPSVEIGRAAPAELADVIDTREPAVVVFSSGECGSCTERLSDLESLSSPDQVALVAVYAKDGIASNSHRISKREGRYDLFSKLGITMTPFGIAVDHTGVIVHARALGSRDSVRELLSAIGGSR